MTFLRDTCKPFYDSLIDKGLAANGDNMVKALDKELGQEDETGNYNNMFHTIRKFFIIIFCVLTVTAIINNIQDN